MVEETSIAAHSSGLMPPALAASAYFELRPLANMGAEVLGLNTSRPLPQPVQDALYAAWLAYGVLVFRMVAGPEEHLRLSHVFGPDSPCEYSDLVLPGQPELIRVSGEGKYKGPVFVLNGRLSAGWLFWHQDEAYTTHIPQGSMLRMEIAPDDGGETGFLDIARAYDDLPETTKRRIDGLECVHVLKFLPGDILFGGAGDFPGNARAVRMPTPEEYRVTEVTDGGDFAAVPTVHPLVITRPESNRRTLLLSPLGLCNVVGMEKAESDTLLHELARHVLQEKYMYIHRWRPDDCVLWDNFTAMHCGLGYPVEQHRLGFRTTIRGKQDTSFRTGRLYGASAEAVR